MHDLVVLNDDFCLGMVLRTRSFPYENENTPPANPPINTLENVSTLFSPLTHSHPHKSSVPTEPTNIIINGFVNRYNSPAFQQTYNMGTISSPTYSNLRQPRS